LKILAVYKHTKVNPKKVENKLTKVSRKFKLFCKAFINAAANIYKSIKYFKLKLFYKRVY